METQTTYKDQADCCKAATEVVQLKEHLDRLVQERKDLRKQIKELKEMLEQVAKKKSIAA
jgi:regulator of replication initiation timing